MSDNDLLSHRILEKQLEREDVNYALKNYEMPVNQQNGLHTPAGRFAERDAVRFRAALPGLHLQVRPDSACAGTDNEVMRQGEKDKLMPPKLVLEKLPGNATASSPRTRSSNRQKNFRRNFRARQKTPDRRDHQAVNDDVFPLIESSLSSCAHEYDPKGRTELTIESLSDGKRRYVEAVKTMTTVNVPPDDIHEIGLKEVARITGEMTKVAQSQGYKDLASFRRRSTNDPKWKPTASNRFWMTTKNTSIRWSRSSRNYLDCCRSRQSPWNRSLTSPKPRRPITSGHAGWETSGPRRCCRL